jgi:hypothetical protein
MQRVLYSALLVGAFGIAPAFADPMPLQADRYNTTGSVRRAPGYIAPQQQPAPSARYAPTRRGLCARRPDRDRAG